MKKIASFAGSETPTVTLPAAGIQPVAQTISPLDMMHAAHGLPIQTIDKAV